MNKLNALLLALVLLMSVAVRADNHPRAAAPAYSAPVYFDPATFDPRAYLPNPPPNNSDATTREIEIILQDQSVRTQAQVDRIVQELHYNVFDFQNAVGPWFTPEIVNSKLPVTNALLARMISTAGPIIDAARKDWSRQPPFLVNSRIFPVIQRPTDSSYPSTHSTRATLDALVLVQIVPGSGSVLARAGQIGDDRVIAGVEFPSDVIAGRKLAQAIFNQLSSLKDFRDQVKAARMEIKEYLRKTGSWEIRQD